MDLLLKIITNVITSVDIVQIVIAFVDSITKITHEARLSQDRSVLEKDVSQNTALAKCILKIAQAENKIP